MRLFRTLPFLLSILVPLALTGCSTSFEPADSPPITVSIGKIQGMVHGGQQPITGSKVYLYAVSTTAYGGNGIAASTSSTSPSNDSKSLLTSATGNLPDGNGNYYVLSGPYGAFSITGDYTCTSGQQLYIYVAGGNPGLVAGTNNSAIGEMALLSQCPSTGGTVIANDPFVYVNEVSTIVAAYAIAGFATDSTHIGTSGSTLAGTGIANAFMISKNLANIGTGVAYTSTSQGTTGSTGTVPQSEIDTLANILADCISTSGPTSSACVTLLGNAKSGGGTTGTAPTDTATAAINIAHWPAAAVSTLYPLQAGVASPYVPDLPSAPKDFTVAITFTGGGVARVATNDPGYPGTIAVDATGSVWTINYSTTSLSKFSPLGVPASGSPFAVGGQPYGLAIDSSAAVWVTDYNSESARIFNNDGSVKSNPNGGTCLDDEGGITFDNAGNAWISSVGGFWVCKVNPAATTFSTFGANTLSNPYAIAGDASGNVWVGTGETGSTDQINEYNSNGTNINSSPFKASQIGYIFGAAVDKNNNAWFSSTNNMLEISSSGSVGSAITGAGIIGPDGVAIDGNNDIWESDYGTYNSSINESNGNGDIVELNSSGSVLSGSAGYQSASTFSGEGIAIDSSGNIWVDNLLANSLRELIGAAAPVVTPMSAAALGNKLGARP